MEKEIITADGDRKMVEADIVTEFDGDVYAFPEDATAIELLVGAVDYDKYEGASLA